MRWNKVLGLVLGQLFTSDQCLYYPTYKSLKGEEVILYLKRLATELTVMDSIE